MITQEIKIMLQKYNTLHTKHTGGRTLFDHLKGTYDLLKSWDNQGDVCMAGLCHSIYGTQIFKHISANITERPKIQEVIGKQAEELAYLFCASDRKFLYDNFDIDATKEKIMFSDVIAKKVYPSSLGKFKSLIEIGLANNLEQIPFCDNVPTDYLLKMVHLWTKAAPFLSNPAYKYFLEFFKLEKIY